MDGEVLNQRMRKFVKPHAGMAQRAIAPVVREAAGNRLEGALRLQSGNRAGAGRLCQSTATPHRLTAAPPCLRNPAASRSVSFA